MTAETCGSPSRPANVAPPLKSTSTKLSVSEEWVSASPSTSVRSSSDLPEPVAPMHQPVRAHARPAADSLMSSSTGCAVVADADRHPQPVARRARAARWRAASNVCGSPRPQQVGQAQVDGQRVGRLGRRGRHPQRLIRRASASASTTLSRSGAARARCACSRPPCSRRTMASEPPSASATSRRGDARDRSRDRRCRRGPAR